MVHLLSKVQNLGRYAQSYMLSSSKSVFSCIPMLYRINYNNQEILFIQTGTVGGVVIHYIVQNERPNKKIIELKQLTAKFSFIDSIGIFFWYLEYATVLMA